MKIIYLTLCLFFTISCNKQSAKNTYSLSDFVNSKDSIALDCDISYIPLENTNNGLVSTMQKIIMDENYIFIESGAELLQFSTTGKFIRQISSRGRGPEEHLGVVDFAIDSKDDKIYLLDTKKILEFDFNGNFIKKLNGIDLCWRFDIVDDSFLLSPFNVAGISRYKLLTIDKTNGDTLSKISNFQLYTPKNGFSSLRHINSCFTKYKDETLFRQQYSDTVYTYNPHTYSILPKYIFDFENKKITKDILADEDKFKDAVYVSELYEFEHYIHILLSMNEQYQYYIIDKSSGTVYSSVSKLKNNRYFTPCAKYNNCLIGYIEPDLEQSNYTIIKVSYKK